MAKHQKKKKESRKQSKKPGNREPGYPWWAKLIVGLFVVGWLAGAALFTAIVQTSVTVLRQATDPAYIAANLNKTARFEKFPDGFKAQMAVSAFGSSFLTLSYLPDNTSFMIWLIPPERRSATARQLTDSMAEKGIPTVSNEFKVEKKGAILVAGETLEYVSGVSSSKQGYDFGGFIGCAILKDRRALLVYGWTPPQEKKVKPTGKEGRAEGEVTFNMSAVTSLLSSIKSF